MQNWTKVKKGFALIYSLVVVSVLLMLVGTLMRTTHFQGLMANNVRDQQQAQLAAESGLALCQLEFERDPSWAGGIPNYSLTSDSSFSCLFAADQSVNNFSGLSAVNCLLGPASLPPGCTFLRVVGRCRGTERRLEVVLGSSPAGVVSSALASSGKIWLEGNVRVAGISSFSNATAVAAELHSNEVGSDEKINWQTGSNVTSSALINGTVSSSGNSASAINASGNFVAATNQTNAAQKSIARIDIDGVLAAHPNGTDPNTLLDANGCIQLPPGDYRVNGNFSLAGDLTLEPGANLYVDGNCAIDGAIRGAGSVVVGGNTTFRGDAELGRSDRYITLLSKGNVNLEGFQADQYIANISATVANDGHNNPSTIGALWARSKARVTDLGALLASRPNWTGTVNEMDLNEISHCLTNTTYAGGPHTADHRVLPALMDALSSRTDSGGRFLKKRLLQIAQLSQDSHTNTTGAPLYGGGWSQAQANQVVDLYLAGTLDPNLEGGIIDCLTTYPGFETHPVYGPTWTRAYNEVTGLIQSVSFDRLGNSVFRGLVYTHGSFCARNDVSVTGMLVARGEGGVNQTVAGVVLKPGDIQLLNGSSLLYVEDMFSNSTRPMGLAATEIRSWVLR